MHYYIGHLFPPPRIKSWMTTPASAWFMPTCQPLSHMLDSFDSFDSERLFCFSPPPCTCSSPAGCGSKMGAPKWLALVNDLNQGGNPVVHFPAV